MTDSALIVEPDSTPELLADPLAILHSWADLGWLRRLDSALANFMRELDPSAAPVLLVSADNAGATSAHAYGHLAKPLGHGTLVASLRAMERQLCKGEAPTAVNGLTIFAPWAAAV